jgi:hypothetical protein
MRNFYPSLFSIASTPVISNIEFAAAHEEIASRVGADVFALLIDQSGIADRAVVPPIFLGFGLGRQRVGAVHRIVLHGDDEELTTACSFCNRNLRG